MVAPIRGRMNRGTPLVRKFSIFKLVQALVASLIFTLTVIQFHLRKQIWNDHQTNPLHPSSSFLSNPNEYGTKAYKGNLSLSSDDNVRPQDKNRIPRVDQPRSRFLKYDEAGPVIYHARTHYLSSIPSAYRIDLFPDHSDAAFSDRADVGQLYFERLYEEYGTTPENIWPQKLHLFEMNPSIAKLPEYYQLNQLWRRVFGDKDKDMPQYVSVYRIGHQHNCYDARTNERLFGGSWEPVRSIKTDYLGVSLIDSELNVILDTTLTLAPLSRRTSRGIFFPKYQDYRLFNLDEKLYLSSEASIAPIELQLVVNSYDEKDRDPNLIPRRYVEVPRAFPNETSSGPSKHSNASNNTTLKVWVRKTSSCPVGAYDISKGKKAPKIVTNKNLLYFARDPNTDIAKVLFFPRQNPNDVRDVDLNKDCSRKPRSIDEIDSRFQTKGPIQPFDSFETMEKELYPRHKYDDLFMSDRGSACCSRVKRDQIHPIVLEKNDRNITNATYDDDDGDSLLVAVVHPKTLFPGKNLPTGVIRNSYFSRFIAFLPKPPYTIVARSGIFCLGYPSFALDGENNNEHAGPLTSVKMDRLNFGNVTLDCPRIHFVTGMVDKVKQNDTEPDTVILSYGVSDCLSRFVEIQKLDIIRMLSADAYGNTE